MRLPPPVPPGPGAPERSNLDELRRALGAIGLDEVDRRLVAFGNGPDGLARMRSYFEQQSDLLRAFKEKPPFEKPSLLFFPMADVLGRIWDQFDLKDVGIASADPMFRVFSDFLENMIQRTRDYLAAQDRLQSKRSSGSSLLPEGATLLFDDQQTYDGSDLPPGVSIGDVRFPIRVRATDVLGDQDRPEATTGTDFDKQLAAMDKSDLFGFFEAHYSIDRKVGNMLIERIWELRRANRISERERLDLRNLVFERLLRGGSDASPATGTDFDKQLAAMDGQALLGFFEAQYSIDRKVGNMLIERIWELRRAGRISEGERLDFMNLVLERLLRED